MLRTYELRTTQNGLFDITDHVRETVAESGVTDGIVVIMAPHTTAGIMVFSFPDPLSFEDMNDEIGRLVPTRIDFKHQHDTPQDAAGHIKSTLVGVSQSVIVSEGKLLLGHSQAIYFFEFDGPRQRKFNVKIVSG